MLRCSGGWSLGRRRRGCRHRGRCGRSFGSGFLFPPRTSRTTISLPLSFFGLLHLPALHHTLDCRFVFSLARQRPAKPEAILPQDGPDRIGRFGAFLKPVLNPLFAKRDDDGIQIWIVLAQRFNITTVPRSANVRRNKPVNWISFLPLPSQSYLDQRATPLLNNDSNEC